MTAKKNLPPRGIRNNNPGNIRRNGDPWQGLAERQLDIEFFTFKSSVYGIRALARTLITYQDKYGLRSIRQVISRWAPPNENDTEAYVKAVAASSGLDADHPLDVHRFDHLLPLTKAIIRHENGQQPYSDAELTKGLVLAGVEPQQASLQASRTVKGGQAATAATAGLGVVEAVQQSIDPARDTLASLAPYLDTAKWLLLVITLISVGVMIWARIDDHRKGLR
jgi:hypothetical protein